ncbi:c-type cytochrome [Pseudalkalibacillus sp. Hm43]|uniref:c-type cytochrome n=1 Tax=Pseudalkalibacillus sp. Hm43 TaxID=3450742 RepID=UPI003F435022
MLRNLFILGIALLLVVGLAACGGGSEESSDGGASTEENGGAESGSSTVDAAAAQESFNQSCASCHGENLDGRTAPGLKKVGQDMNKEEILAQIKNGGSGMPPNLLEGEEAENVAAWLATMK